MCAEPRCYWSDKELAQKGKEQEVEVDEEIVELDQLLNTSLSQFETYVNRFFKWM